MEDPIACITSTAEQTASLTLSISPCKKPTRIRLYVLGIIDLRTLSVKLHTFGRPIIGRRRVHACRSCIAWDTELV